MQRSRFVFLAMPAPEGATVKGPPTPGVTTPTASGMVVPSTNVVAGARPDSILWVLVSPNNRLLGRGTTYHALYAECRESVEMLQANAARVVPVETTVERTGQWTWRIELDGVPVAVSSRSYLRAREGAYNLGRFLEALPTADIVAGTRSARRGRQRPEPLPPSSSVTWRRSDHPSADRIRGGLAG